MRINISTLNVQSGVGVTEGYWQYLTSSWKYLLPHSQNNIIKATDFVTTNNIDILVLTEIDAGSLRSRKVSQIDLLSGRTALKNSIFFEAYRVGKLVNQGNAIMTRYAILESQKYRLHSRGEPRYLGMALLRFGNRDITIFAAHLSLNKKMRHKQFQEISDIVYDAKTPVILCGDFNTEDESELSILMKTGLKKSSLCKTYPAWKPRACRDHIYTSCQFRVQSAYAPTITVSDHLPLVAELVLD